MDKNQKEQLRLIREVAYYLSGLREGKRTPLGDVHIEALFSIGPIHAAYVHAVKKNTGDSDEEENK